MKHRSITVNVDVDVDIDDILAEAEDREEILDMIPEEEIAKYAAKNGIRIPRGNTFDIASELIELCNAYKLCHTKQDLREICEELIQFSRLP